MSLLIRIYRSSTLRPNNLSDFPQSSELFDFNAIQISFLSQLQQRPLAMLQALSRFLCMLPASVLSFGNNKYSGSLGTLETVKQAPTWA